MDQAPQALSNILGNALGEIREELNELKQSNTLLLKKNEALEAAHNQSTQAIFQLQGALKETRSRTDAVGAAHNKSIALNRQLWGRLKDVQHEVAAQCMNNRRLNVSLAGARNELAAVKMLLDAMGSGQR